MKRAFERRIGTRAVPRPGDDARGDLIVRVPNWVGDVCKSLPALDALERAGFQLYLVARPPLDDLLAGLGQPVVTVGKGVLRPARALRRTGCRRGLLLTTSFGTAASARLAGVRVVGFSEDRRDWLLYRAVPYPMGMHEVDAHLFLARVAQETFAPQASWSGALPATPRLRLGESHREDAAAALRNSGLREPFTLLCPMATGTRAGQSKVWPHWAGLSRELAARGRKLVVCPGPGEEQACASAVPEATQLPGLGLGAYAALCERAERVVANDSGPLHLAAAVGARVTGIYAGVVGATRCPRGADHIAADDGWPTLDEVMVRLAS